MNEASRPVYGLVLAGGRSRRMGKDKALLAHAGKSQLERAFGLLAEVTEKQFVSTRPDQQDEPERARFPQIVDCVESRGPIAGILSALAAHPDADWLVLACDLPNLDVETLEYLVTNRADDQPFTSYTSSHDGLPEPLCAIYGPGSQVVIQGFVDDDLICPRKMLIKSDTRLLEQPNPASLDNVNTPQDLEGTVLGASA